MSHVRRLMCRVDDEDDGMTDLASVDLAHLWVDPGAAPLVAIDAQVARIGPCVRGRVCVAVCASCNGRSSMPTRSRGSVRARPPAT